MVIFPSLSLSNIFNASITSSIESASLVRFSSILERSYILIKLGRDSGFIWVRYASYSWSVGLRFKARSIFLSLDYGTVPVFSRSNIEKMSIISYFASWGRMSLFIYYIASSLIISGSPPMPLMPPSISAAGEAAPPWFYYILSYLYEIAL